MSYAVTNVLIDRLERQNVSVERTRQGFMGVGLNLNELLLGQSSRRESELRNTSRLFFEHIKVPHTAAWGNRSN